MPVALLVNLSVNVPASAEALRVPLRVQVRNADLNDFANLSVVVTRNLADAVESPYRLLGLTIEMDDGAGLRVLKRSELGAKVELNASLDGVGRVLKFSRFGADLSPAVSDILRGQRRIRVTGQLGVDPSSMEPRLLFDGFLRTATFQAWPPVANIEAQDSSLLYSEKHLELNIPEGSGRTRLDILNQVLGAYSIPAGTRDLGPNNGGIVKKAISIGADQNVIEWIRSFVAVLGRRVRFTQDGRLHVGLFAENETPVRALRAGDISNLSMTPPATNEANRVNVNSTVVTLVSQSTSETGASSTTVTTEEVTLEEYAPQIATRVQSHTDGAVTDRAVTAPTRQPVKKRVSTTTTLLYEPVSLTIAERVAYQILPELGNDVGSGSVIVSQNVKTYEWYAQRACQFRRDGFGAISFNNVFDVYLFGDGSARASSEEEFLLTSDVTTTKLYVGGVLLQERVTTGLWAPTVVNSLAALFVNASGEAWDGGKDNFLPLARTDLLVYALAPDRVHLRSISETIGGTTAVPFFGYVYQNTGDDSSGNLAETIRSGSFASLFVTVAQTTTAPQSITGIATDSTRVALSTLITAFQQNDFCETADEAHTAAYHALRDLSKMPISFDMPVDLTLEDGETFTLPIPRVGSGDDRIVVGDIAWMFDGSTGENSQRVTGWLYPANLRVS